MAEIPDQQARDRISRDLDTNMLVEAGAGSGKTTALVDRMVALVLHGEDVSRIAAVTFTRKAAAELRHRFQARLEEALRDAVPGSDGAARLDQALRNLDRGFVGTLHAFCARLLRERPLEAGLDPAFEELMESDYERLQAGFWRTELERMATSSHADLEALLSLGIRPEQLHRAFGHVVANLDLPFPASAEPEPEASRVAFARVQLENLLDEALALWPERRHEDGMDPLQTFVRDMDYDRTVRDWTDSVQFLAVLEEWAGRKVGRTLKRWSTDSVVKGKVGDLADRLTAYFQGEPIVDLHQAWLAHRYDAVLKFVLGIAERFQAQRLRTARLGFQDLLVLTARLLRTQPRVRRDLGDRYRRILIDEFQDTDPIQAEIAFLLASDPESGPASTAADGAPLDPPAAMDWRSLRLRPGALFVVGDPKQSIYRFRRADIEVYNEVRTLIEAQGAVLVLSANFRSVPAIAELVNATFSETFPEAASAHQAPFREMRAQREDREGSGVFTYEVPKGGRHWTREDAVHEAEHLAAWIAGRVARGERKPDDFLILTDRKKHLDVYGRALEAQGLPMDLTGADVDVDRGWTELLVVLEALVDPGNPVLTTAALTGLFFGVDHEQLTDYALSGGRLDFRLSQEAPGPVAEGLERLAEWWRRSRTAPADVFVGWLVRETGLLVDAMAGPLGRHRAGVLRFALDAIRTMAAAGDTSLVGAIEALQSVAGWADAETPLEPGRSGAVRVMNIHKAKGLQAPVVILATPGGETPKGSDFHVRRHGAGDVRAFLAVTAKLGQFKYRAVAWPPDWEECRTEERRFLDAERDRIRYVAATRAEDELVVATRAHGSKYSPWGLFDAWLAEHATRLDLEPGMPRPSLGSEQAETVLAAVRDAEVARARSGRPSYQVETVTTVAKASGTGEGVADPAQPVYPQPAPQSGSLDGPAVEARGYAWGSVVHEMLAAAGEGRTENALRELGRSLLLAYDRPLDDAGHPTELGELLDLVSRVRKTELWTRAQAAPTCFWEVPFAWSEQREGRLHVTEGVIDLVFREADGWILADFKTDVGDDPDFEHRAGLYRNQVDTYATAWSSMTGEDVVERVLLWVRQGGATSW